MTASVTAGSPEPYAARLQRAMDAKHLNVTQVGRLLADRLDTKLESERDYIRSILHRGRQPRSQRAVLLAEILEEPSLAVRDDASAQDKELAELRRQIAEIQKHLGLGPSESGSSSAQ